MSKVFKGFAIVAVISLLGLAAIGCGIETKFEASPEKVTLAVGATQQLTITRIAMGEIKKIDVTAKCTYTSSDESVATVSGGLITGVKPGSATITVSRKTEMKGTTLTDTTTVPVEVK